MRSSKKATLAISIGDLNGIGFEIALRAHKQIKKFCEPIYCIDRTMAQEAAALLSMRLPSDFQTLAPSAPSFTICPGQIDKAAGAYSYASFMRALKAIDEGICDGVVTLPIHKEAWMQAGIAYKGHTDALRAIYQKEAIMMLGCEALYVALFSEHVPLSKVCDLINQEELERFLINLQQAINAPRIGVLGLNPHAGDQGVLGDEENIIRSAIKEANHFFQKDIFHGPLVPDVAFTPAMRRKYRYLVAMYHDQGLAPLKALYFDESVNMTLNLPIIRTSVDHGTAFDIAYRAEGRVRINSYLQAIKVACEHIEKHLHTKVA